MNRQGNILVSQKPDNSERARNG